MSSKRSTEQPNLSVRAEKSRGNPAFLACGTASEQHLF
ncbi:hypothetical protein CHCC14525_2157 [Bacillus licheniformis]|nr:hypothetical protein CHCC20487_0127 [Bacillus licheniformis]TWN42454.1 hypothetical protein CHCC14525_2157 [Bacillus licheniformis]